jgi:glycosyltransferase involved in cell wall biosynthesis
MRIAFVSETWAPSVDGVVTRLRATLLELGRLGHQLLLVAPDGKGHREDIPGVEIVTVPSLGFRWLSGGRIFGLPWKRRIVEAALRDFQPDLVHILSPYILGRPGIAAARSLGIPLVTSFHQDLAASAQQAGLGLLARPIWWYVRRQHSFADRNLVTSRSIVDLVRGQQIGNVELWPFGADLERFDPARRSARARRRLLGETGSGSSENVIALYVGRLAPEKGLRRLYPLARTPGVRLVMVGDGPMREELERDLAPHGVRFTGWLRGDDLADAYASADVFTFPSTTETLGFVLIEAMASGLPVLAARSAPSTEILGPDGRMIDDQDWPEAGRLVTAMAGTGWADASAAARNRALSWDWSAATRTLLDIYRSIPQLDRVDRLSA